MSITTRAKRSANSPKRKSIDKNHKKPKVRSAKDYITEYRKYFVAPSATPDAFRVLDLTDGSGISYSSHT
jgi:hypothetical protein